MPSSRDLADAIMEHTRAFHNHQSLSRQLSDRDT